VFILFLSVVIPSKDEPLLEELAEEIHKSVSDVRHEVIIIEKGHKLPRARNAKVFRQESDGLGAAVVEGVEKSKGDVIVTMDGDFSHDPKDIPKLLDALKDSDIAIGSRFVEGGETVDTRHRRIISLVFRKFASLVLSLKVNDNMSGFAAIKREVYDSLYLNPLGYKINLEIAYKGSKAGFKVSEVPITFRKRREGESKADSKEAFRILRLIFRLKWGGKKNIVGEINKYRKSYGIKGISSTLLNGMSYLLNRNPIRGPIYVGWEILWRCDAKCEYCNRWKIKKGEPSTDEAIRVIRDVGKLGTCIFAFTGGEPLLRNDIGKLIRVAKEYGMVVNINTNGSLLKAKARELVDSGCDIITVSAESHDPKTHDKIRGFDGLFNLLMGGIKEVKRLRKGDKPNIKVRANVNRSNYKDLDKYLKFWSNKVDEVVLQPIHDEIRNAFTIPKKMMFTAEEKKDFTETFNALLRKYGLSNEYYRHFPTFFFDPESLRKKFKCYAGHFFFQMDPELNVYPCAAYMHKVGNLKDSSIEELWKSEEMKKFRNILRNRENRCVCWYNCNGILNCYLNKTIGRIR